MRTKPINICRKQAQILTVTPLGASMKFTGSVLSALAVLMSASGIAAQTAEVNLYSSRQEALIKPLLDEFTKTSGIKVNLVSARADSLVQRLQSEGRNTPADVLLTVDAGNLAAAQAAGLLQPLKSAAVEQSVPAHYRDPAGYWTGLSLRARPIFYARDRVRPAQLSTYSALTAPQWKGKLCLRSSDNIYNQSMVAAMIAHDGVAKAESWARGLVANFARPPKGGDRDQIKAVAAGECDLTIANTYYFAEMAVSSDAAEREAAAKVGVFWPDQQGRGAHVNVSGAGIIAGAKNVANARRLIEYLTSASAQAWYAEKNQEYPVLAGVTMSATLAGIGQFKADQIPMAKLGEHNADAVKLMDRAGWR
jgi:iron(III) transport system substrate-binding protein